LLGRIFNPIRRVDDVFHATSAALAVE